MLVQKPIWGDYVTHDSQGIPNGICDDAPQEDKDAYAAYLAEIEEYNRRGEMIPK